MEVTIETKDGRMLDRSLTAYEAAAVLAAGTDGGIVYAIHATPRQRRRIHKRTRRASRGEWGTYPMR